jgi:hypothetical protein
MYYWFYGSQAMQQLGGPGAQPWQDALRAVALDAQVAKGDDEGSWDPVGPWGHSGGRVYSTAMMVLGLRASQRLTPLLAAGR